MKKIGILILLVIVSFFGLLYYTLRTKVQDVSSERPYSKIVGNSVEIKREMILVLNRKPEVLENDYLILELGENHGVGVKLIDTLRIASDLKIEKAKLFTNGTSGFTTAMVLGKVYSPFLKKLVSFEYNWGDEVIDLSREREFIFSKGPWETEQTKGKFTFH